MHLEIGQVDGVDELAVSYLPQDGIGKGGTDNL
jgi:hypothetical protein